MLPDRLVVLVNGLPASGKSTLARPLAVALALPLFSKDDIKETHADLLGAEPPDGRSQRAWNQALGAGASETMWALQAVAPTGAVLESSWRADVREQVARGLDRAGVHSFVEVWCDVPAELARQRDAARWPERHAIHGARMTERERERIESQARPLGLGPVIRVDTWRPVDIDQLAEQCRRANRPR